MNPEFSPEDLTFAPNLRLARHRWYPLTEGFSDTFVEKCIDFSDVSAGAIVLDPFGGSGTTAVAASQRGFRALSFEINPLLAMVGRAKISSSSAVNFATRALEEIESAVPATSRQLTKLTPGYPTLRKGNKFDRWLFHDVALALFLPMLAKLASDNSQFADLVRLSIAKAAEVIRNAKRDGKTVRYKTNWRETVPTSHALKKLLIEHALVIAGDLVTSKILAPASVVCDSAFSRLGAIAKGSVGLVVTSPPYLNSRDYTDVLNGDMWLLGVLDSYEEVRRLRRRTVDSHLQLPSRPHRDARSPVVDKLVSTLAARQRPTWQQYLPNMVAGYFGDMNLLLVGLKTIMKRGALGFINVAESAYDGMPIHTLDVLKHLATRAGFRSRILIVREIRRSAQQFSRTRLHEGVLVIQN